jgi:hypothetical protein
VTATGKQTNEQVSMASARRVGELGDDPGAPAPGSRWEKTAAFLVHLQAARRRLRMARFSRRRACRTSVHGDGGDFRQEEAEPTGGRGGVAA